MEESTNDRKVRVCIASKLGRESAETFIRSHMERLPCEVRILSGIPPHTDDRSGFILKESLWRRLRRKTPFFGVSASEEELREELTAQYLVREAFDVVLAEYGEVAAMMLPACRRAGVPLVAHFHGHDAYSTGLIKQYGERYQEIFRDAAAIVGVSHEMVRQLVKIGAPPEKVNYISYFVDGDRFTGAEVAGSQPHFVGIGRFVETKAPYFTLMAFAKVLERVPDARLTIVGDGPLRNPCLDIAEHLGIADRVALPGNVNHEAVAELLRSARAFVQHSIRCRDDTSEGTPNAVLEAQAAGVPVIATRHAGICDVVVDGWSGILGAERDVAAMGEGMVRLALDASLAAQMGQNGRDRVRRLYSFDETLGKLAGLLRDASERRPRLADV